MASAADGEPTWHLVWHKRRDRSASKDLSQAELDAPFSCRADFFGFGRSQRQVPLIQINANLGVPYRVAIDDRKTIVFGRQVLDGWMFCLMCGADDGYLIH